MDSALHAEHKEASVQALTPALPRARVTTSLLYHFSNDFNDTTKTTPYLQKIRLYLCRYFRSLSTLLYTQLKDAPKSPVFPPFFINRD